MNVYSGAGAKPNTAPVPMSNGLIYRDPFPGGGTCFKFEAQYVVSTYCLCSFIHETDKRKRS